MSPASASFITPDALLSHWQAHRRLTRRVIDAFPDDKLFTCSVGGMRTFGELAMEMVTMGAPMLRGLTAGQWDNSRDRAPRPKQELLRLWDEATTQIDALWKKISPERFHETATAFGQFTAPMHDLILTSSTTRFTIAGKVTSICARSPSSRHLYMIVRE